MKIVCINPPKFLKRLLRLLKRNKKPQRRLRFLHFGFVGPKKEYKKASNFTLLSSGCRNPKIPAVCSMIKN